MVFYIHDQGNRIQTPIDGLLRKPLRTTAVQKASAIAGVDKKIENTENKKTSFNRAPYSQLPDENDRLSLNTAKDIMCLSVTCVLVGQCVDDVISIFDQVDFHHLPVMNKQQELCGIISDRDVYRLLLENKSRPALVGRTPVETAMTKKVVSAEPITPIRTLAEVMSVLSIGAIPIIADTGLLQGIVSRSDILRSLVHSAPLDLWS